ncbi:ABC transporter substrate-binding protein [Haladaptatus sp. CMAA 1911]|uniref:ABC transporter substrate-binding protein n=1 Tax=unclassified Haladaptatus TaxID=2622732 RepID=UPI00375499D5
MNGNEGRTRRTIIKSTGAVLGGGLLAGCTSGGDSESSPSETTGTSEGTTSSESATTEESTTTDGPYSVSMAPVGEVEFESVPKKWVANNGSWADMGIALGLEPPKAVWLTGRYHTQYYDAIDGLSVDKSDMVSLYQDGVSKELFYQLDADVHVMDPNFLMNRFKGWKQEDVDELTQNIAPLFGNCIYAQHYTWHDSYRYYTLMEGFERLSKVFKRHDRYEAFADLHADFQSNVSGVVPKKSERPSAAVVWGVGDEPTKYYPYIIGKGTGFKHLNDLGVSDALANTDVKDFHGSRGAIDLETLLKVDPEVLLLRGYEDKTRKEFKNSVIDFLQNDNTASKLTAVENGDVYRAGGLYQGPITNLVLTQRTAKLLYGVDKQLYDSKRVVDIVNGDF